MPAWRAQREEAQSRRMARRIVAASLAAVGLCAFLVVGGLVLAAASLTAGAEVEHVAAPLLWSVPAIALAAGVAAAWWVHRRAGVRVAARLGAEPLRATDRPRQQLQRRCVEMAVAAGVPTPTLWLRPGTAPNVSAWSERGAGHLAFTAGALGLPQPELAVLAGHGCARLRLDAGRDAARTDGTAGALLRWTDSGWADHRGVRGPAAVLAVLFLLLFSLVAVLVVLLARSASRQVRAARRDRTQAADALAASFVRDPASFEALMDRMERLAVEGGDDPELVAATSFGAPPGTLGTGPGTSFTARTADARRGWSPS